MTPELLTEWFSDYGSLTQGSVLSARFIDTQEFAATSTFGELELTLSENAIGPLGGSCLAKTTAGPVFMLGRFEAEFFQTMRDEGYSQDLPVIRAIHLDEAAATATILMDRVRDTAPPKEWPIPPTLRECERAIDVLAGFHRHWYASPLAQRVWEKQQASGRFGGERFAALGTALIDRLGDALSRERRALIEHLCTDYPAALDKRINERSVGLVHGDAHFWNFVFPSDPHAAPTMVDWQLWGADLPTADLVYMLALHWFPERRARFERSLLARYADAAGRSEEAVSDDYRFSAAGLIPRTVLYASVVPATIWWPHLERAFNAYEDLGCAELF